MVLFKRKPVKYLTSPKVEDDNTEVWYISQTDEVFVDYEAYLNRMDFYKQNRFICQITGHSGLNFFDALKSELAGAEEVEQAFPEALKGPVLRRVQFRTISRIDNLVDMIFDEFKADYYPNEAVTVHVITGERLTGIVREKTRFSGGLLLADGTVSEGTVRYFVSLDNRPNEEAVVDDTHITRDRKIFTKQVLRSFIKKTVTREAWTGAPWLVKEDVARIYHIDTKVPLSLRHENKIAAKKEHLAQKKANAAPPPPEFEGMVGSFPGGTAKLPELKPAPKSHKSKQQQNQGKGKIQFINPPAPGYNPSQYLQQAPFQAHAFQANGGPHPGPPPHFSNFQNSTYTFAPQPSMPALPPPPPPIKYPIEDLQVAPRKEVQPRPQLKYFSQDTPVPVKENEADGSGIFMSSVGPLLETWDTLNVYCEVFKLDSFTFDDYVEAMQFTSEDVDCELFVELHCAALKLLVSSEADGSKVQVQLPEIDTESDDENSANDTSAVQTPTPEPEPKPKGRTTRSSLAKVEAAEIAAEANREPSVEKETHRAAEMQAEYDWIEKLAKREFKDGGWQVIIVGLLHQLSKNPRHKKMCEELLEQLAPVDQEPTMETARLRYSSLDINLRVKALQILCMLTVETKAIRGFMEEGSEVMTKYRKEKIVWQRDRKIALEELRLLNEERKIQLPANTPPDPEPEGKTNGDVRMNGVEEEVEEVEIEDEIIDSDEDIHMGRSLRRGNDRAAERQRKREEEQERKEKAEAAAKVPKQTKQFTKLLKDIQKKQDFITKCEKEIAIIDNDLREADCPRTRVLGKDRFWNRYYWFERNGMPYGGLPDSSTAEAGYANGCIWVQGPDDIEREGYVDMKEEWQNEYKDKFKITVPERKKQEEGTTNVFNAHQWGYIDDPTAVDKLIEWLDPRGFNELKLQKEMKIYREKIVAHMQARNEYLHPTEEKQDEKEPGKRMSTRTKQHQPENAFHRCLNWHNNAAVGTLGHIHSEQPRVRKGTARKKQVGFDERETRSKEKNDKGGRQGR